MTNPLPDGYPRVSPSLAVAGAADAIDFYVNVLGFEERLRMEGPGGAVAHAELALGDSLIMLADEFPDMGFLGPKSVGGTPVHISVYVEDVDAVYAKAIEAGATPIREPQDEFYGDRSGHFEDAWGHRWGVATHVEDVSAEEMDRRMQEMMGGG